MGKTVSDQAAANGISALSLMEEALALLDRAEFPGEVGADLDHAICRLRTILKITSGDGLDVSAPAPGNPFGEAKS